MCQSNNQPRKKTIIMGAAGRDFHNFNTYFRDNAQYEVVAFTAEQIPGIEERKYPAVLSGPLYPEGVSIYPEEKISQLIKEKNVTDVVLAYSDLPYDYVVDRSSVVNAAGANFILLGPSTTMIKSTKPLLSVCAVRTGCGKSQTSRRVLRYFNENGIKCVTIRHPMPYGDLSKQVCQRFASYEDMDKYECTIEEREEYEPYLERGDIIYAGVDYEKILREAEKEADVILWDGGNNDFPFYCSNLEIVVVDPHRPNHEISYYPGSVNFRRAQVLVMNKMDSAEPDKIAILEENIKKYNPDAILVKANSKVEVEKPALIKGKKVLVVEDGPTLTHGGMEYGAGIVAAQKVGVEEVIDPRPYAVGSIADTFKKYGHLADVLPAMGYGSKQMKELEQTINKVDCDAVLVATPIDLGKLLDIDKPSTRATYTLDEIGSPNLAEILDKFKKEHNL